MLTPYNRKYPYSNIKRNAIYFDKTDGMIKQIKFEVSYGWIDNKINGEQNLHDPIINIIETEIICKFQDLSILHVNMPNGHLMINENGYSSAKQNDLSQVVNRLNDHRITRIYKMDRWEQHKQWKKWTT